MSTDSSRDGEHDAGPKFLHLIDRDITEHPERLRSMPSSLYRRLVAVTAGVSVKLDTPIEGEAAL